MPTLQQSGYPLLQKPSRRSRLCSLLIHGVLSVFHAYDLTRPHSLSVNTAVKERTWSEQSLLSLPTGQQSATHTCASPSHSGDTS